MIEDKLNRDERIRLESLNQAIASIGVIGATSVGSRTAKGIIDRAEEFEKYIRGDEDKADTRQFG